MFSNLKLHSVSLTDVHGLLSLFVEWWVVSDSLMLSQVGARLFLSLATRRRDEFLAYVTPNLVLELLTSAVYSSRMQLIALVAELMRLLKLSGAAESESTRTIHNITRTKLYAYLTDHGVQLPVAVAIARLYTTHPEVLPHREKWTEFTVLVVKLMAGYRMQTETAEARKTFSAAADEVGKMLPLVWGRSTDTEGVQECLKTFYDIISTESGEENI
jgi:hypothetical protein